MPENDLDKVRALVREHYGSAAAGVLGGGRACCDSCCGDYSEITANLYGQGETEGLPQAAQLASLGCGNPGAIADLSEGEVVVDLGSGGGLDAFLAARKVGPSGRVIGVDMTDEMLALAEKNRREAGLDNVEFRKGNIEDLPIEANSVDVIISNCVVNLSPDKDRTLREAFRVLRPGGRIAISDVVHEGPLTSELRSLMTAWSACLGGTLTREEYRAKLEAAGFTGVQVETGKEYDLAEWQDLLANTKDSKVAFASAYIRAVKPKGD